MSNGFTINIARAVDLSAEARAEIIALCSAAYNESFDHLFELLPDSTHVLGRMGGHLCSHAAWVTRWLQPEGYRVLRTAYVEAVATQPEYQGRGLATAILRTLREEIREYDLGALSPSEEGFYERLGWELWRGPLAIRSDEGVLATPDERVMVLRLVGTPNLNIEVRLTAEWREGELW